MIADKHPLMIILGMRLAKDRKHRTEDIASKIGCATSTYRLAESGSLILNPALSLKISKVFEYEYTALTMLLVAMQTTAEKSSIAEIMMELESIADAHSDNRLKLLLSELGKDFWKAYATGDVEKFKEYVKESILDRSFNEFLKSADYGKSSEVKSEEAKNITEQLFSRLPSLYYDHLDNFLNQLDELPIRIRFSDLGRWEENNLRNFSALHALIKDENAISHPVNLKNYKFSYLWQENFQEANFIFYTNSKISHGKLVKKFHDNMWDALKEAGDQERLSEFDYAIRKVRFKILDPTVISSIALSQSILTGIDYDDPGNKTLEYDGFWTFERTGKKSVSFLATLAPSKKDASYPVFSEGLSLNSNDTDLKLDTLKSLWKKLK